MKNLLALTAATFALAGPAFAEGDVEAGEKAFKKCKACHTIVADDGEVIFKGGKTGPNLYGVVGRVAGSTDFKYGDGLKEAGEAGFVWTAEAIVEYTKDPKAWLGDNGFATKSKMSYKLKKGGEDVAAYLKSVGPVMEEPAEEEAESTDG